jgi:hypothetical protein
MIDHLVVAKQALQRAARRLLEEHVPQEQHALPANASEEKREQSGVRSATPQDSTSISQRRKGAL